jgi:hypothetical protein
MQHCRLSGVVASLARQGSAEYGKPVGLIQARVALSLAAHMILFNGVRAKQSGVLRGCHQEVGMYKKCNHNLGLADNLVHCSPSPLRWHEPGVE